MTALARYLPEGLALFLRGWVEDPRSVGAVAPSGRRLADLMTREIPSTGKVVELGPGTGSFTRAILDRGVAQDQLALVELNAAFASNLQQRFSGVSVICGSATDSHEQLGRFEGQTSAVVSGLPLVLFSGEDQSKLLLRSFELLRADGAFYQFTYGGRCPVSRKRLASLGLRAARVGLSLFNLPPAFVYRISRVPVQQ